jgi:hypothetical protein
MSYLALFRAQAYRDEYEPQPGELDAVRQWREDLQARGMEPTGWPLRPALEGTMVRVRNGEVLRTDGPFAETKEVIGGFEVLDCATLDEAIELVSRFPAAAYGCVELREIRPADWAAQ